MFSDLQSSDIVSLMTVDCIAISMKQLVLVGRYHTSDGVTASIFLMGSAETMETAILNLVSDKALQIP